MYIRIHICTYIRVYIHTYTCTANSKHARVTKCAHNNTVNTYYDMYVCRYINFVHFGDTDVLWHMYYIQYRYVRM